MNHESNIPCRHSQWHCVLDEVICHFPFAALSLTIGLILLSIMTASLSTNAAVLHCSFYQLFHTFHYLHILFAAAGSFLTFLKYSRNWLKGIIVGLITPVIFCVLSDIVLPYCGGALLGVHMHLHICFITEYTNVIFFLLMGLVIGAVLRFHMELKHEGSFFTRGLHFGHIFLSSMAALFYLISHGFVSWAQYMGPIYVMLVIAVVIPCTLSDIVVPIILARSGKCDGCNTI